MFLGLRCFFLTLLAGFIALQAFPQTNSTASISERFLTLPYNDSRVSLINGPVYTVGGNHWSFFDPQYAMDFATSASSSEWAPFQVYAAAPGYAMQTCSGIDTTNLTEFASGADMKSVCKSSYGRFVLILHDVEDSAGRPVFSLYSHLDEVDNSIPFKSRSSTDFTTWKRVERGARLGTAGNTGLTSCDTTQNSQCAHLHFEIFSSSNGYTSIGTTGFDPFDISTDQKRLKASGYFNPNGTLKCGPERLWIDCPPRFTTADSPPKKPVAKTPKSSVQYVTFTQGNPRIPGDGITVTGLNLGGPGETVSRYDVNEVITLGTTQPMFVVSAYSPQRISYISVQLGFTGTRCVIGVGGNLTTAPTLNRVSGAARVLDRATITQIVNDYKNSDPVFDCRNVRVENAYIHGLIVGGVSRLDAAAVGLGENSFPTRSTRSP